jgi:hypothetical protein
MNFHSIIAQIIGADVSHSDNTDVDRMRQVSQVDLVPSLSLFRAKLAHQKRAFVN